jgi:murein L,D-transpeptidase YafK
MKHRKSFAYLFRYNLKKIVIDYQTARFDREIKSAYRTGSSPFSGIPLPALAVEHPFLSLSIPAGIALIALAFTLAPKLREVSFGEIFPVKAAVEKVRHAAAALRAGKKADHGEIASSLTKPFPARPAAKDYLFAMVADKTKKTLTLFKYFQNGKAREEKTYNIMIGATWGRKSRQGDLKTPEGFYWVINRMERYEIPPMYGARAFILNYPNEQDVAEGRSGTGIWIHGYQDDNKQNTKGCLVLDNNDLEDITEYIGIGTPILITESAPAPADSIKKYFAWNTLLPKRDSIIAESRKTESFATTFLERWRAAWESKDIEAYASLYAQEFNQNGMAYPEWKEYKRAIFSRSADISVNVSDVKLVRLDGDTATVRFTQEYLSGDYRAVNGKMLKIVKTGNDWKIKEESRL